MNFDVNNPYFRTKVLTASREELRLLLLEGCVRFMTAGRDALARKDFEKVFEGFSNAKAILLELINTLDHSAAPELCSKMSALYTYVYTRLTEGSFEKNLDKINEAIRLMEYERETWSLLIEKVANEKAQGRDIVAEAAAKLGRSSPGAAPTPAAAGAAAQRAPLSLSA